MPSALFSPITVRSATARNRLWVAPMCQYSVTAQDGVPGEWHLVHLGSYARGGAGLVMAEATAVGPEGRISPADTGLWNDDQARAWKRIVDFIHSQGALAAIQLAHAGRKGSTHVPWEGEGTVPVHAGGWETVAPSPIAFTGYAQPRELSAAEIEALPAAWAAAATRAMGAGFDAVEVHAAHGYLLHEFLSPLSNQRTDQWGGSLENRARLVLDVIRAVRAAVGAHVPVLVRFSATDWAEPEGWTLEQTVTVARWAQEAGADLVDLSSGGLITGVDIPVAPGYQVPFAATVRSEADAVVSAVGLITSGAQAERIIADGQADVIMVAREFLRDPHLPLRAAHELGVELDYWPQQYSRGRWRV